MRSRSLRIKLLITELVIVGTLWYFTQNAVLSVTVGVIYLASNWLLKMSRPEREQKLKNAGWAIGRFIRRYLMFK